MTVSLRKAQELASSVRLSEDKPDPKVDLQALEGREHHKDAMLRHGVLISEAVTPVLEERLACVCDVLGIPRASVTAFVYNSADIQADCLIETPETCILRFTSGLINLMDEEEFKFVAGHEIGHFLLGHGMCARHLSEGSLEDYMVDRARELSADRIGFLSINSADEAIQAIIKMSSGLNEQFLRFDVSSFLSQISMISKPLRGEAINSTHPSMLIRCRALLWFSMSIPSIADAVKSNEQRIREINSRVAKDLEKFVDGQMQLRKSELEDDVTLWKSAQLIFQSGSFTKETQSRLSGALGKETLRGIKSFFNDHSRDELQAEIPKRLDASLLSTHTEFPTSAEEIENTCFERARKIAEG